MSKLKLTFRQKQIILILIDNFKNPKRIKDISNELNVSSRTIMRELHLIEEFFDEREILFVKKSGVGIFLDGEYEKINKLREEMSLEYPLTKYSKNDRVICILENILHSETKSTLFLNKFKISYSTFSKDLDYIKSKILTKFDLKLLTKKGLGIYIEGSEDKLRELSSYLFYEKFSGRNLYLIFQNYSLNLYDDFGGLLEEHLKIINQVVEETFLLFNIKLSHKAYSSLMVHLIVTLHRMKDSYNCEFPLSKINEFKKDIEFNISKMILNKLNEKFEIEVKDGDICYISMHLKANNICGDNYEYSDDFNFDRLDRIKISGDIICEVQKILGISLIDSRDLIKNLSLHLGPAINRLFMNMNIRNSFLGMMKTEYKEIFDATKKACLVLENVISREVPDSEVGYITMHIVAAYERKLQSKFKYRVLIYSEGERRVTSFLYNKITKEFPNVVIVNTIDSFDELRNSYDENIDFIISTSDIKDNMNYIKVGVDLSISDILIINDKIKEIFKLKSKAIKNVENKNKSLDIDVINYLGNMIKFIEENFKVNKIDTYGSIQNVIKDFVYKTLSYNRDEIFHEILRKEMISSSYVKELGIIILHTISKFSKDIYIGSYILSKDIPIYNGNLNIIFYFIIPEELNTKVLRKVIGELTSNLVKDDTFIDILKKQDILIIREYIRNILSIYYVEELKGIIEKFENGIIKER